MRRIVSCTAAGVLMAWRTVVVTRPLDVSTKPATVHVRLARARPSELNLLRTIASSHPGSARLFLYIRTAAREERVVAKLTVSASRKLVEALQGLVGRGEVWVE